MTARFLSFDLLFHKMCMTRVNTKRQVLKMKKESKKLLCFGAGVLALFALWTVALCFVDVRAIGPRGSSVGFSHLNGLVHNIFGVHWWLYIVTDWLGLVPIAVALGFAVLGLVQWIKRKLIWKVDSSILILGGFYLLVIGAYILFEFVVINRRPVVIDGYLEVSYPSSTTMLVMTVIPTAVMQLKSRIRNSTFRKCVSWGLWAFTAFMVIGRLVSGVHWFSDIIGGVLLSAGLVLIYCFATSLEN